MKDPTEIFLKSPIVIRALRLHEIMIKSDASENRISAMKNKTADHETEEGEELNVSPDAERQTYIQQPVIRDWEDWHDWNKYGGT